MSDVDSWLEAIGLGEYVATFADNKIDRGVLPELTEQDLKDLGIPLGHRKKLLKAVAALAEDEPLAPAAPVRPAGAERRQLTVMFCDLVGSTELAARLDPEDLRVIIGTYRDAVAAEVARFDGFVAQFLGDGVLAYFGWPRAHEDDAERAVRAGLAAVARVDGLTTASGERLLARVGIATGVVVVGELIGREDNQQRAVVGETPNLAARLQGLAAPNGVLITEATRRLVGAGFDLDDLGAHALKGLGEAVVVFAVRRERPVESRFEARRGPMLLPMVGREQELAQLLECWRRAKAGAGQSVLLIGEAGIGKSRIVRALLDAVAAEPHMRVRYQCSPYHADSAMWPVVQQLTHAAGLAGDDPIEGRLDKLEALLARAGNAADAAPLIADLLGLDGVGRYGALDLTPQAKRARTLEALEQQMLGLATQDPLLIVLEDAHWIDPTTLELIERCLGRITAARVLILVTSRMDQQPELAAHPPIKRLTLNQLGRAGVKVIVERLGGDHLPAETIGAIIARTDGVPLFVEELTKAILETGETTIPASLHDSLMARLDRIPEVKEVAQIAACVGREFDASLLAEVADRAQPYLVAALDQLTAAELIFCRGTPPDARYAFKHTLVGDAAYASLLRGKRQQLHARIAQVLQDRFPDMPATEPELLAGHYRAAGLIEQATMYWQKAGQLAVRRSATSEAISHFGQALSLLGSLTQNPELRREELELQLAIGPALIAAKGYAASETVAAYTRARELCAEVGDTSQLVRAHYGQAVVHMLRAEHEAALKVAGALLRLVEHRHDSALLLMAHRLVGASMFHLGRLDAAREHLERALALYDPEQHRSLAFIYAEDPEVAGLCWLSWTLFLLGFPDQARARSCDALSKAEEFLHRNTLAYALVWDGVRSQLCRDRRRAEESAEALVSVAAEHRLPLWLALGMILRGWTLTKAGRVGSGLQQLRKGLDAWRATGAEGWVPYFLALLADGNHKANPTTEGLESVAKALVRVEASGARWIEAELHRLRGELLLAAADRHQAEAEACFRVAIKVACLQNAKSWQLRASTSLARLWAEQGERRKAHDLLAPVYGWFTEGFDTPDLKDARVLLDELC